MAENPTEYSWLKQLLIFWWLRSENQGTFSEKCVMCSQKLDFVKQERFKNRLNVNLPLQDLVEKNCYCKEIIIQNFNISKLAFIKLSVARLY